MEETNYEMNWTGNSSWIRDKKQNKQKKNASFNLM